MQVRMATYDGEVREDLAFEMAREDQWMGFTETDRQAEAREWADRERELYGTTLDALGDWA